MNKQRYAYAVTSHIFYDNGPDETVRFIYDMVERRIVQADILRSLGWKALSEPQQDDLVEWLNQYTNEDLYDDPDFDFEDKILEFNDD